MGNWAFEIFHLLAMTDLPDVAAPTSRLLFDGGMLGAGITAIVALGTVILFLFRSQHRDVETNALALEQIASSEFVHIILRESRRIFSVVDENLPSLLSQESSDSPSRSRFDEFCKSIKDIKEEELDDRGKYAGIVRGIFANIISDNASQLIDTLDASDTALQHAVLNPTHAHFGLEGDTFLTFVVVSKFDSRNRRIESWFRWAWNATAILLMVPFFAAASVLIATTIEALWAEELAIWSVWIGMGGLILATVTYLACFWLKNALARRARRFSDPKVIEKYIDNQKGRHGRKNH